MNWPRSTVARPSSPAVTFSLRRDGPVNRLTKSGSEKIRRLVDPMMVAPVCTGHCAWVATMRIEHGFGVVATELIVRVEKGDQISVDEFEASVPVLGQSQIRVVPHISDPPIRELVDEFAGAGLWAGIVDDDGTPPARRLSTK